MGLRGKRAALTLSPKVRLQMTLHVSKENSSWMATGVPAWALMRCRGETGYMGCGDRGTLGEKEADPRRTRPQELSLTSQNSWASCSTRGSMESRMPSIRAERESFLWAFHVRE